MVATKALSAFAALSMLAMAAGCGAGRDLRGSINAYEAGNFRTAEARCSDIEQGDFSDKAQVRYLVYCGLTHYQLGEADQARTLLASGNKLYATGDPGWLKPMVVDQMNKALIDLNGATPAQPAAPASQQALRSLDAPGVDRGHTAGQFQ